MRPPGRAASSARRCDALARCRGARDRGGPVMCQAASISSRPGRWPRVRLASVAFAIRQVRSEYSCVAHNRLEYQHALRGIVYLRMLAGERSPRTPIASDRWGNYEIPELPAIDRDELELLKARIKISCARPRIARPRRSRSSPLAPPRPTRTHPLIAVALLLLPRRGSQRPRLVSTTACPKRQ